MKRTSLQRKTPMPRGSTTLARTTRVKPQSAKRQVDAVVRRGLVARLLKERPICEGRVQCKGARAVDVDEIKSRAAGGDFLDPANCQTLCRACHSWKHEHPQEAHDLGLLRWSWE